MENPMDPDNQQSSGSRFRGILGSVLTGIGTALGPIVPRLGSVANSVGSFINPKNVFSHIPVIVNTKWDWLMLGIVLLTASALSTLY